MSSTEPPNLMLERMHLQELEQALPNQYCLLAKVSQGGMGAIYHAKNRYTGAELAIKVLLPRFAQDQHALQRFVFEAKSASSLKHPNICSVHDFGVSDGQIPYLVMDWVNGISLQKKIERDGPMDPKEACYIFMQVAQALEHAHQRNLMHRDLKPDNIMLRRSRTGGETEVLVVDFGIAKVLQDDEANKENNLTATGMILGTPYFMSPEQARGLVLDGRSDIYSLGCVMYFSLAGVAPFRGETMVDTIYRHCTTAPPEISGNPVPAPMKTVMLKCLEKQPEDRYATMAAVCSDLDRWQKGDVMPIRVLAKERQSARNVVGWIVTFVVGFGLTFAISVALQSDETKKAPQSTGAAR